MAEDTTYRNALPLNSRLHEYRLESVLGAGGFGMTYLGWDSNLEKHVAIKEYLPGELAVRALDGSVVPVNTEHEYNYKWGLERFIQEARTLAKFSHPNIVRVNRYFEANGTSYMVMDYEAGESLHQYLKRLPMPDEATLKKILLPILDGLQAVHHAGFLHRDIKPSNVFLRENGTPVLIDFGSSRLLAGRLSKSLTAIVSPGYAPLEQYSSDGNQGPWSDIYALAGVMYRAVTGENPPDAVKRMKSDGVPAALNAARTRYDERFLRAVEWGLKLDEKLRPQNVADWRELFSGRTPMSALNRGAVDSEAPTPRASGAPPAGVTPKASSAAVTTERAPRSGLITRKRWKWLRRGAFIFVMVLAVAIFLKQRAMERDLQQRGASQGQPSAELQRQLTQRFEAADVDHSGDLNREEMARRLPRFAVKFDEIDVNHDGVVSLRELEQFLEKDGIAGEMGQPDGAVPPVAAPQSEVAPAPITTVPPVATPSAEPKTLPELPPDTRRGSGADAAGEIPFALKKEFIAADRDGNGYLSPDEVRGRFPAVDKNFSAVDANHDGRISLGELWEYRKKMFTGKSRQP